jgi:hypothetical protein
VLLLVYSVYRCTLPRGSLRFCFPDVVLLLATKGGIDVYLYRYGNWNDLRKPSMGF